VAHLEHSVREIRSDEGILRVWESLFEFEESDEREIPARVTL